MDQVLGLVRLPSGLFLNMGNMADVYTCPSAMWVHFVGSDLQVALEGEDQAALLAYLNKRALVLRVPACE